jgi:predicted transcriptional regulator
VSTWSAELDRIEQRLQVVSQELDRLGRRFTQHEQAVIELAAALKEREDVTPRKGKRQSRKP